MNKQTVLALGVAVLIVFGAIHVKETKTASADWEDEGAPVSCRQYNANCQLAGGRHSQQSGEEVNGIIGMTCDGIRSGTAASELTKVHDGAACNPELGEKRADLPGYCVVAKCKVKAEEEELPMYY